MDSEDKMAPKSRFSIAPTIFLISALFAPAAFGVQAPQGQEPVVVVPTPERGEASGTATATPYPQRGYPDAILAEGTVLEVRLTRRLDSEVQQTGDRFDAVLERDIERDGRILLPKGTDLIGVLPEVADAGRVKGRARMSLELKEIVLDEDHSVPIESARIEFQAKGSVAKDAKRIGVAAGIGAIIGAIAGGGDGAAIGAAIGGGAATASVLLTEGEHVKLEAERLLSFRLQRDVHLR